MKFKEWQATAQYLQRVEAADRIGIDFTDISGPCMLYEHIAYIERIDDSSGIWMLTLSNFSDVSNDLLSLEKKLYRYLVNENMFVCDKLSVEMCDEIAHYIEQHRPVVRLEPQGATIFPRHLSKLGIDEEIVDRLDEGIHGNSFAEAVYTAILLESINGSD